MIGLDFTLKEETKDSKQIGPVESWYHDSPTLTGE